MNPTVQALLERRSVRAFEDKEIPREILQTVVTCGAYAPSALNGQTRRFTVVTDKSTIRSLCEEIGKALGREGYDMYCPAALILPSDSKDNPFFKEDLSCALENLFVSAHALGIGSVWINQLSSCCDIPSVRALLNGLGIPPITACWALRPWATPSPRGSARRKNKTRSFLLMNETVKPLRKGNTNEPKPIG